MGPPQLMTSFISEERVKLANPDGLKSLLSGRDARFKVDHETKAEKRKDIGPIEKHPGMCVCLFFVFIDGVNMLIEGVDADSMSK